MRLYHTILLLSALILGINATFQGVWLYRFALVRESVVEFGNNWMPSVRLSGELIRATGELRRLELQYALAQTEAEQSRIARGIGRQVKRISQTETKLRPLLKTDVEIGAFDEYLAHSSLYHEDSRAMLEAGAAGQSERTKAHALAGVQTFASLTHAMQTIEFMNQEYGTQAEAEADRRFSATVRGMVLAGLANIAVCIAAAVLAARRISRPIASLARHMVLMDGGPPGSGIPVVPDKASEEVSVLYGAFTALSRKLALSMERLEAQAVTDQLTGVANRRKLMEEGAKTLDICRRGGRPCSALMLDLDHFKAVNDTHGHAAGDAVLRRLASVLAEHVRASDILARYGGEEFALLAPNSGPEETRLLAERLRQAVESDLVEAQGARLKVTVSIGVASDDPGVQDLAALLDLADKGLYAAKEKGRNRVEAYGAA